jgi:hypothetical protein
MEMSKAFAEKPWDPDGPTLEEGPEYKALQARKIELQGLIANADGRINTIFFGKA